LIILHIINILPIDESESKELRHYISQKPDPAEAPLLPAAALSNACSITYTAARLMFCTCLPQAGLRQKQRLQNLGNMIFSIKILS